MNYYLISNIFWASCFINWCSHKYYSFVSDSIHDLKFINTYS